MNWLIKQTLEFKIIYHTKDSVFGTDTLEFRYYEKLKLLNYFNFSYLQDKRYKNRKTTTFHKSRLGKL